LKTIVVAQKSGGLLVLQDTGAKARKLAQIPKNMWLNSPGKITTTIAPLYIDFTPDGTPPGE